VVLSPTRVATEHAGWIDAGERLVELQLRDRQRNVAGEDGAVGVDVGGVAGAEENIGGDRTAVDRAGDQVGIGEVEIRRGGRAHEVDGERDRAGGGGGDNGGLRGGGGGAVDVDDGAVAVR